MKFKKLKKLFYRDKDKFDKILKNFCENNYRTYEGAYEDFFESEKFIMIISNNHSYDLAEICKYGFIMIG